MPVRGPVEYPSSRAECDSDCPSAPVGVSGGSLVVAENSSGRFSLVVAENSSGGLSLVEAENSSGTRFSLVVAENSSGRFFLCPVEGVPRSGGYPVGNVLRSPSSQAV